MEWPTAVTRWKIFFDRWVGRWIAHRTDVLPAPERGSWGHFSTHAEALAYVQGEQIKELCRKDPGKALGMAIMLYAAINRDKTE